MASAGTWGIFVRKFVMTLTIPSSDVFPFARRVERADAAANRALLISTAERLFAEYGVANVTMADIALTAGVGKGTLYRRFENKAELCLELMDSQMRSFQEATLARLQKATAGDQPYLAALEDFLDQLVWFVEDHLPLLTEVQRAGLLDHAGLGAMPHAWFYMTVHGLLRSAARSGEISRTIDTSYVADAILAPLRTDVFGFHRHVRRFSLERISEGLRSLVSALANIP
jgi:AcrR family transcriptional regulator